MKEIKYIAYIKHLKWLVPVLSLDFVNKEVEVDLSDGFGDTSYYNFDEVELLQYVNQDDDLGNGIYEGFIIKHIYHVYMGEGFVDQEEQTVLIKSIQELPFLKYGGDVSIEILGNKYENPELLSLCKNL